MFDGETSDGERLAISFLLIVLAGAVLGTTAAMLRLAETHRGRLVAGLSVALALATVVALVVLRS